MEWNKKKGQKHKTRKRDKNRSRAIGNKTDNNREDKKLERGNKTHYGKQKLETSCPLTLWQNVTNTFKHSITGGHYITDTTNS